MRLAEENGVSHAQLPISKFVKLQGRRVLSINQVFEILLHFTESRDWQDAFVTAIPSRRGLETKPCEAQPTVTDSTDSQSKVTESTEKDSKPEEEAL